MAVRCGRCQRAVIFLQPTASPELERALCPRCARAERDMVVNSVALRLVTALMPSGRQRLVPAIEQLVDELREYGAGA